jgi:hypothetical protein
MLAPRRAIAFPAISRRCDGPVTFFPRLPFSKSACMLRSAYIRFGRRLSLAIGLEPMAHQWLDPSPSSG